MNARQLEARWLRVNSSGIGDPLEGFILKATGQGSFVGIHSMAIANWKLRGGKIIIATKTERHKDPSEESSDVTLEPDGRMTLTSQRGSYPDGTCRDYEE